MTLQLISSKHSLLTNPLRTATNPGEIRAIAKDAFIYGYPMVDLYATLYAHVINKKDSDSDAPPSVLWLDLRAEPVVLHLPAVRAPGYYSVQLIDLYTHHFAYLGTPATGRAAGAYMIAGPHWKGKKPAAVKTVIPCETSMASALYHIQRLQRGFHMQTLSAFLKTPHPMEAPVVEWPKPEKGTLKDASLFRYLNFLLTFAPAHPSEIDALVRFTRIGVGASLPFHENRLPLSVRIAMEEGIVDAWQELARFKKAFIATRKVGLDELFGTRASLKNNYLYRFVGAALGLSEDSHEEAVKTNVRHQ